jgi:hypothetical protein
MRLNGDGCREKYGPRNRGYVISARSCRGATAGDSVCSDVSGMRLSGKRVVRCRINKVDLPFARMTWEEMFAKGKGLAARRKDDV